MEQIDEKEEGKVVSLNHSHTSNNLLLGMLKFAYLISFFGYIHDLEMVTCSS